MRTHRAGKITQRSYRVEPRAVPEVKPKMIKQVRARFYGRAGGPRGTGEGGPPVSAMREHPRLENRDTWDTRHVRHYYHRTYDCDLPGNRDSG
jgi:hypothetical protein